MGATGDQQVSATRVIDAPADKIFSVLADPAQHAAFDGSGTVRQPQAGGPERLELGARFGMEMKYKVGYKVTNEVVEFEEGRRIGWRHMGHHVWRYELEPTDGATRVTETFDWSKARGGFLYPLLRIPKRNLAAIEATLERLDAYVTGSGD